MMLKVLIAIFFLWTRSIKTMDNKADTINSYWYTDSLSKDMSPTLDRNVVDINLNSLSVFLEYFAM